MRLKPVPVNHSGFSLIELAIVLFIISIILSGVLTPLSVRLEQEERKKTSELLEEIRDSLVGFTQVNGYLPCPDCTDTSGNCGAAGITANDGIEDGVDAGTGVSPRSGNTFDSCAVSEGNLPWATLGVTEHDAWDNYFLYRVTDTFADDPDGTACSSGTTDVSFCLDTDGNIDVDDESGNSVAADLPFVVISLGSDDTNTGASQGENQDGDTTFVYRDYSAETDAYDDLMTWVPSATLKYQMVKAGKLP